MKFYDTQGREHKIDVRPSRWARKELGDGRGKYQSQVGEIIADLFPGYYVLEEFPCLGEGLYLDFFLPTKSLAVEVQGSQHHKFNAFFHKDKAAFARQQSNDARKAEWCEVNSIRLVKIDWGTSEEIVKKSFA